MGKPFTKQQEAEIRRMIADAVIGARAIHPMDQSTATTKAIRGAILDGGR